MYQMKTKYSAETAVFTVTIYKDGRITPVYQASRNTEARAINAALAGGGFEVNNSRYDTFTVYHFSKNGSKKRVEFDQPSMELIKSSFPV